MCLHGFCIQIDVMHEVTASCIRPLKKNSPQIIVQGITGKWAFIAMRRQGMSGVLQCDAGTAAHPMTSRQIMCP